MCICLFVGLESFLYGDFGKNQPYVFVYVADVMAQRDYLDFGKHLCLCVKVVALSHCVVERAGSPRYILYIQFM